MSDGTVSGTNLAQDIYLGSTGSNPTSLTASGSTLYFVSEDGYKGYEVYFNAGIDSEVTYS